MKRNSIKIRRGLLLLTGFLLALTLTGCYTSDSAMCMKERWKITGRGKAYFEPFSIFLKDCLISDMGPVWGDLEFEFTARSTRSADQVQVWSGFSFRDRNTRYALGLRGGNSNDLYLCRYRPDGRNTMLALAPIEEELTVYTWYKIRIALWDSTIAVFLNDEREARILLKDEDPIGPGAVVLGGGWTITEYRDIKIRPLQKEEIARLNSGVMVRKPRTEFRENEEKRQRQRNEYHPQEISLRREGRTVVSLDGEWLFKPEHELSRMQQGMDRNESDENWHVLSVPGFWNPVSNWMYLQNSGLPHPGSGVSDNYRQKEMQRCAEYTFNSRQTSTGWYRHWIRLPGDIQHKSFFLNFDAVSKTADVWVNGTYVGGHIGMFGDFSLDITDAVLPGMNLIAVRVRANPDDEPDQADMVEDVAVTVEVTRRMLHSLPHGMFGNEEGGIWQPVRLLVTGAVRMADVFIRTSTEQANVQLDIMNSGNEEERVEYEVHISSMEDREILYSSNRIPVTLASGASVQVNASTPVLKPALWSPEHPNLHLLEIRLYRDDVLTDRISETFGFRTFGARGNRFYLNGKPYWLRGANHPPLGTAPNDSNLAGAFLKLMHENNQMITRTHGAPLSEVWVQAADRQGVGLSVEGTWPWLMLGTEIPSADLLDIWKKEMLALVKKYRNHPSVLIWTMGNEMYFTNYYHNEPRPVRMKKWKILSDAVKAVRALDPTRPVCATSGYIRYRPDYEHNLKPSGIDDGDLDDSHNSYFGWYNPDQFYLYDGNWTKELYLSTGANPDRPFITQELSSGYPNNDTGHPTRKYIFQHYVPQAWVGDWAYEDHDPSYFLQRHAFLTKEIAEVLRRTSPDGAGILHFANTCWFRNVDDYTRIEPYPVVPAMKKALQPVLVSAELYGRSFYAGTLLDARLCIVNDLESGEALNAGILNWQFVYHDSILTQGSILTDKIDHYERYWIPLQIGLPERLPSQRIDAKLKLTLDIDGGICAENDYDMLLAEKSWLQSGGTGGRSRIYLYDPNDNLTAALAFSGISAEPFSLNRDDQPLPDGLLVVAGLDQLTQPPVMWKSLREKVEAGGRVILIHPGNHIRSLLPEWAEPCLDEPGNVVNMHIPESPVFRDINPPELSWWQSRNREEPIVCRRSFRFSTTRDVDLLVTYLRPHAYLGSPEQLKEMSGSPLAMIRAGRGKLLVCELELEKAPVDPVAGKILVNIIHEMMR